MLSRRVSMKCKPLECASIGAVFVSGTYVAYKCERAPSAGAWLGEYECIRVHI